MACTLPLYVIDPARSRIYDERNRRFLGNRRQIAKQGDFRRYLLNLRPCGRRHIVGAK